MPKTTKPPCPFCRRYTVGTNTCDILGIVDPDKLKTCLAAGYADRPYLPTSTTRWYHNKRGQEGYTGTRNDD